MYCEYCGIKKEEGAIFCQGCGKTTTTEVSSVLGKNKDNESNDFIEVEKEAVIKCGNCEYIGKGQKARSTWAIVLAWVCVVFAPMVTIIYYLATSKYRCPKCESTFLGVKNEYGVFVGQNRSRGGKIALIFVCIFVGIAIIGIMASVVLASLNSARSKAQDASIKANLSSIRAQAELYWDSQSTNGKDGNYTGLCSDTIVTQMKNSINTTKTVDIICKDNYEGYAISVPVNSGGYWCVDSSGFNNQIPQGINSTSCSFVGSSDTANTYNPTTSTDTTPVSLDYNQNCDKTFPNSYSTGIDSTDGKNTCDCKSGYSWNNERTSCVIIKSFPNGCTSSVGFSATSGLSCDGKKKCGEDQYWDNSITKKGCYPWDEFNKSCDSSYLNTYWNGSYGDTGDFICDCKIGYTWDSGQTGCY